MKRSLAVACFAAAAIVLLVSGARAESLADIFRAGNEAGYRGDWGEAAKRFEALVASGVDDADVHFNLGVAYAHEGRLGHAVLGFERSLRLRSGDAAAAEGLAAARAALGHRRAEREGEATVQTRPPLVVALLAPISETSLAWLLLALDIVLFGLLVARPRARGESVRVAVTVAWPLVAFACVLATGALLVKSEALGEGRAGIVLREDAALREGPTAQARERGRAPEGAHVRILENEGRYARVAVPGGTTGWMHTDDVAAIRTD